MLFFSGFTTFTGEAEVVKLCSIVSLGDGPVMSASSVSFASQDIRLVKPVVGDANPVPTSSPASRSCRARGDVSFSFQRYV